MVLIECDDIKFETKNNIRSKNYSSVCSQISKSIRAMIFSSLHEEMYRIIHIVVGGYTEEINPDGGRYAIVTMKE